MLPEDYVERVKRVHESGGYGSRGYVSVLFLFFFFFLLTLSIYLNSQLCDEIFPVAMIMSGKEKRQTKTFCELIQLLFLQGCSTCLHRFICNF